MAWEIERRFLVHVSDALWCTLGEGHHYRQGYIGNGGSSVRIRTGEPRGAVLTCKIGSGIRREETEVIVPTGIAARLLEAAQDRMVEKIRWHLGPWEVDRFLGTLDGLALMEVELNDESDPLPVAPQSIDILREVTTDNQFSNSSLAYMSPKNRRKFVKKAYKGVREWTGPSD